MTTLTLGSVPLPATIWRKRSSRAPGGSGAATRVSPRFLRSSAILGASAPTALSSPARIGERLALAVHAAGLGADDLGHEVIFAPGLEQPPGDEHLGPQQRAGPCRRVGADRARKPEFLFAEQLVDFLPLDEVHLRRDARKLRVEQCGHFRPSGVEAFARRLEAEDRGGQRRGRRRGPREGRWQGGGARGQRGG